MTWEPGCIFCEILAGRAVGTFVYRDDLVAAFMSTGAVNPGHVMVIPVQHASSLAELDPAVGGVMFQRAMQLATALRTSGLRCEGVHLLLNDGRAAFQSVFHVHLHVFPRFRGDGFGFVLPPDFTPHRSRRELEEAAALLRAAMVPDDNL
jgi:histidine triad (HIT) family protein